MSSGTSSPTTESYIRFRLSAHTGLCSVLGGRRDAFLKSGLLDMGLFDPCARMLSRTESSITFVSPLFGAE